MQSAIIRLTLALALTLPGVPLRAQAAPASPEGSKPELAGEATGRGAQAGDLASPRMIAWLKQLIADNLPETYEDTRKWDLKKLVWDGVDISREGLKIKTKRKHKEVNHGTWTRYRLQSVQPEKNLLIEFHQLEVGQDGKVHFAVSVQMLLEVFGRLSQWVRDVQMISLSANAQAVCRLTIQGEVAFQLNALKFPPDVRIKPHVDAARVEIVDFRVDRISQIRGALAEQLGKGLRVALESKLEESNQRLPEKMNQQLDKHQDRMQFSTQEWLQSKLPLPAAQ